MDKNGTLRVYKKNEITNQDLWKLGMSSFQQKWNRWSGVLEIARVRIPAKVKLHVGFDGNWARMDTKKSEKNIAYRI